MTELEVTTMIIAVAVMFICSVVVAIGITQRD
jgi:hypothetical protein